MELLETFSHSLYSLSRVFIGVSAAIVAGILIGLARHGLPVRLKRNFLVNLLLDGPKYPPPIAWIPFVILLMGIGESAAWLIVFIAAFSPIFTNVYEGAESLHPSYKEISNSMELKTLSYLHKVVFPAIRPQIMIGTRVGISMGWMSVIAAEMISGQSGLGYSIQLNRLNLQYSNLITDMFLIGLIGYLLNELVSQLEKRLIFWDEKIYKRGKR